MKNSIPEDPFDLTRLSDNFFIMLGRFATFWAAVEFQVDLSIILIREHADGAKLCKRHPMDLERVDIHFVQMKAQTMWSMDRKALAVCS